jgi:protein-L-isoaspartate(D-aspartate) O-methyltransferase
MAEGWAADAPYDLILIDGSIGFLPEGIIEQLAPAGRLGAVLRDRGIDRLVIGQRSERGFGLRSIADSEAPELPGFERPPVFTF